MLEKLGGPTEAIDWMNLLKNTPLSDQVLVETFWKDFKFSVTEKVLEKGKNQKV